jgi:hypothetical protein
LKEKTGLYQVAYSKDSSFGLPILSTKLAAMTPCLNPFNVEGEHVLAQEVGAKTNEVCPTIKKCDNSTLPRFDSRYRELDGLTITKYDLYNENGMQN